MKKFLLFSVIACLIKVSKSNPLLPLETDTNDLFPNSDTDFKCGVPPPMRQSRIIYGEPAFEDQFPYQVLLQQKVSEDSLLSCGGTIISSRDILTAAHCVVRRNEVGDWREGYVEDFTVTINEYDTDNVSANEVRVEAESIIVYPMYDAQIYGAYDLAIVRFKNDKGVADVITSSHIVCLPMQDPDDTFINKTAIASGWGISENNHLESILQYTNLTVVDPMECQPQPELSHLILCTSNKKSSICAGDSGGPLVTSMDGINTIIGVASFGNLACRFGFVSPAAFMKVTHFLEWILSNSDAGLYQREESYSKLLSNPI